jgi:hypothetical protein
VTIDQRIERLRHARKLVAEAVTGCAIPQLECTLREADMNLHWALWNLGDVVELMPDLETQAGQ